MSSSNPTSNSRPTLPFIGIAKSGNTSDAALPQPTQPESSTWVNARVPQPTMGPDTATGSIDSSLRDPETTLSSLLAPGLRKHKTGNDMLHVIRFLRGWVSSPQYRADTAEKVLLKLNTTVLKMKLEEFDPDSFKHPVAAQLFDEIAALRRDIGFQTTGLASGFTEPVARALSQADLALDGATQQLLVSFPETRRYVQEPGIAQQIPHLKWAMDSRYQKLEDLPDVFFMTSDGATEANGYDVANAIRRATAFDSPVSHVAMVVRHEGKFWIAEAVSSQGVYVHPLDDEDFKWFKTSAHVDILVANHPALQKAFNVAGKERFLDAKKRYDSGNPIPYRFDMKESFIPSPIGAIGVMCQGFADSIYDLPKFYQVALENGYPREKLDLLIPKGPDGLRRPGFRNRLDADKGVHALAKQWGITNDGSNRALSSPGDTIINPLLRRVGSGDATENVLENLEMRVVYRTMFKLMNSRGYFLKGDYSSTAMAGIALGLRQMPLGDILLGDKLSTEMPTSALASILDLRNVSSVLGQELHERNAQFTAKHSRSMTFQELTEEVEKICREDLETYCRWLNRPPGQPPSEVVMPKIHFYFQPLEDPRYRWFNNLGKPFNQNEPKK